jgi:hypothetical protein
MNDSNRDLSGRRFARKIVEVSSGLDPWHTWIIFKKV